MSTANVKFRDIIDNGKHKIEMYAESNREGKEDVQVVTNGIKSDFDFNSRDWTDLDQSFLGASDGVSNYTMLGMEKPKYRIIDNRVDVYGSVIISNPYWNRTIGKFRDIKVKTGYFTCYAKAKDADDKKYYMAYVSCIGKQITVESIVPLEYSSSYTGIESKDYIVYLNFSCLLDIDITKTNINLIEGCEFESDPDLPLGYYDLGNRIIISGKISGYLSSSSLKVATIPTSAVPEGTIHWYAYSVVGYAKSKEYVTRMNAVKDSNDNFFNISIEWAHHTQDNSSSSESDIKADVYVYIEYFKNGSSVMKLLPYTDNLYSSGGETKYPMIQILNKRVYITGALYTGTLTYTDRIMSPHKITSLPLSIAPYEPISFIYECSGKYATLGQLDTNGSLQLIAMKGLYTETDATNTRWYEFCCSYPIL